MEKGAWQATVHSVAKSQTQLRGLSTKNSTHSLLLKVFALINILLLCCDRKKGIISQWVFSGGTSGRESVWKCGRHQEYLEHSMDKGAWWATVHGVSKRQSDYAHTHNTHIPQWIVFHSSIFLPLLDQIFLSANLPLSHLPAEGFWKCRRPTACTTHLHLHHLPGPHHQ